jgi:MGT family glycosyltransferase
MPKIAIFNVAALGHINPTVPVVQELVRRQAEVVYFAAEELRPVIEATGARFEACESSFGKERPGSDTIATFPERLINEGLRVSESTIERIKQLAPDVIIYDKMALAGRILARHLGVRAMIFCASYASNEHFVLAKMFGRVDPGHQSLERFHDGAARVAALYGGAPLTVPELMSRVESLNIVFMARAFQYEGDTFDARFAFVGPSIAPRPLEARWAPATGDNRPMLLVSLGTLFNEQIEFYRTCFQAFKDTEWRVVMAVGRHLDMASLGAAPPNFEVVPYVPQLDVLPHTKVFVHHGGMNSTQESLYFGVPMVVVPQMPEQAATARRVAELGLGRALERDAVTVEALKQAVEGAANDPEVKARVARMQDHVRTAGGQKRAAELILEHLER